MFGKKPAPPPAAPAPAAKAPAAPPRPAGWAVQILTADYLVGGYLPPIDSSLVGFLNIPTQSTVTVAQVQIRGLDAASPNETAAEATLPKANILVFIPRDEGGMRSAAVQMPQRAERAMVYVGPWHVRGAFRLTGDMPLRNLFGASGGDMIVFTEAEITCPRLGATFAPLQAPILFVNKTRVQLYHPMDKG